MTEYELSVPRTFDAPASEVFELWADRDERIQWWGPKAFTCPELESDFRVGGAWRACIVSAEYGTNWMSGVYQEIVPNERIVFSFAWEDRQDDHGIETIVTVTFTEKDGKTLQTFHQAPFVREEARDSHIGGWNQVFDKEEAYVAKDKSK
jgi:uncharacterized protein YndB with AHSA1/START domain